MKYKVGDKVKIVNERVRGMNFRGRMDKYLGTTMTIVAVEYEWYEMKEDCRKWAWSDAMIEGLAETKTKVYNDGNKTVVILPDGRKGEAKCSPNDEFNPVTGVAIAYGRALAK